MDKYANLEINGKNLKIPLIEGSENEIALDISKLRSETGYITIDKGFKN